MKHFFAILFFLFVLHINAQINLVPNGSFEDTVRCPDDGRVTDCEFWFQPSFTSPDFYYRYSCAILDYYKVPYNGLGFQEPQHGDAYFGMITGYPITFNPGNFFKEYVSAQLIQPLIEGQTYKLSYWINLADSSVWASNNFGVGFFDTLYVDQYPNSILKPIYHFSSTEIFESTNEWVNIEYCFQAEGNEKFICFGNFSNDTVTTYSQLRYEYATTITTTYLLLDNVSLISISEFVIPNVFTPNNDEINDLISIETENQVIGFMIVNRWGQIIHESTEIKWDGTSNDFEASAGVYYYLLLYKESCSSKEILKTGYIHLIR